MGTVAYPRPLSLSLCPNCPREPSKPVVLVPMPACLLRGGAWLVEAKDAMWCLDVGVCVWWQLGQVNDWRSKLGMPIV